MASKAELLALASACEQAREGGLFSLDTQIAYALDMPLEGLAKPYTASLDAAMSLVPEDECWRVGHDADDPSGFMAQCSYTPGPGRMGFVTGSGITAALALTAAALRARAATMGGSDD